MPIGKWKSIQEIRAERLAKEADEKEAASSIITEPEIEPEPELSEKGWQELGQDLDAAENGQKNIELWGLCQLLEWQVKNGQAFLKETEYKEPAYITVDYDITTDEWLFIFRRTKEISVYSEWQYSIGGRLSAAWDRELHGWRFPAVTYNILDMMEFFEKGKKENERWKDGKFHGAALYRYYSNVAFTEFASKMLKMKQAQEERWVSLKSLPENTFTINDFCDDPKLLNHQINGSEFLITHDAILADDMGTGKTRIMLNVGWNKFKNKEISRMLVVCVLSGKDVWRVQAKKYFRGRIIPIVVSGTYEERLNKLEAYRPAKRKDKETGEEFEPMPLYIINYAGARAHPVELQNICDDAMMVLDESHNIKSASAEVTKVITALRAPSVIPISGSIITNVPMDAYSQISLVKKGLVGRSPYEFENYFSIPDNRGKRKWIRLDEFNKRIKPYVIRRTKEEILDLPGHIFVRDYESIPLGEKQKKIYRQMALQFVAELEGMDDKTYSISAANIVTRITKLLQICDGFLIQSVEEGPAEWIPDACKPKILHELLKEYLGTEEIEVANGNDAWSQAMKEAAVKTPKRKMIIWSRFIEPLKMLETELAEYNPVVLHGQVPEKKRGSDKTSGLDTVIGRFHNDPKCRVFLGQIKSGGQSVDLTCADSMIFYNQWWAPGDNEQAMARAERIGQTSKLTIIPFVTAPTIEQYYFASEFEDEDGNEQTGILYQKKGWKDEAIDGGYVSRITKQQLISWLQRI